ncbi:MAG: MAPEG family protein [Candidatus Parcubacteria bacterium]|nr:MAPEG family protein [Candidatus Paceibacterota bacterium]
MLYFLSLGLIIVLTVILTLVAQILVSMARYKYKIEAPKTVGDDNFERAFRAHQNQLEANNIFLPLVYVQFPLGIVLILSNIFSFREGGSMANLILILILLPNIVWLIGRSLYVYAYNANKPKVRFVGGILAGLASVLLLLFVIGIGAFLTWSYLFEGPR